VLEKYDPKAPSESEELKDLSAESYASFKSRNDLIDSVFIRSIYDAISVFVHFLLHKNGQRYRGPDAFISIEIGFVSRARTFGAG
jgi:nucleosome binding factor SPN SPT16 subunit